MRKDNKQRNQEVLWMIQDFMGVASIFGIGYAMLFIGHGLGVN